ncbi:MAG TPA: N-acetyltransferase, partial [Gemmataceae bacterium]
MGVISPQSVTLKQGGTFVVRSAKEDDAGALIEHAKAVLTEGIFGVSQADEFTFTLDEEREWIRQHNESPGDLVLVAEAAGSVVALLFFESGPRKRQAHRGSLHMSVERAWRGKGVGEGLLNVLMAWAKGNPLIEKVGLSVLSSNTRAIGLYKKLGFIEEGRRPREIKMGPREYVDEILM